MKYNLIIVTILLAINSFAQDFTVENIEHNKVLYRGYENKLIIGQIGHDNQNYEIEPVNCTISKFGENENVYIVKVNSSAKVAQINFISEGKIVESTKFFVKNLPVATLFWGKNKSGSNFSDSQEITASYAHGVPLMANFEVISWKCHHKAEKFVGNGNLISKEMLTYTNSMVAGESIVMEIKIKNTEGTISTLKGTWVK